MVTEIGMFFPFLIPTLSAFVFSFLKFKNHVPFTLPFSFDFFLPGLSFSSTRKGGIFKVIAEKFGFHLEVALKRNFLLFCPQLYAFYFKKSLKQKCGKPCLSLITGNYYVLK